ncbi:MAG: arginine--tRNA ligase [Roseburia sp.]|nr:arginine--tRNA ligase [Anaeroplasma bactoclasticum]MCM1196790.1 arginine--tRNA ligase [Roseburia sp.]MCM1557515.1 arginine--tRNA ligase [Anaeroplasma bactoclasticum]
MIEAIKEKIKLTLEQYYKEKHQQDVSIVVEEPKNRDLGDISIPMFSVIKILRRPMPEIISEAIPVIQSASNAILSITNIGAFINLTIDKKLLAKEVLTKVVEEKNSYGASSIGKGKNITLDYSSPNIAKSFSIGHLRSTIIGNSIRLILNKCGYQTYSINYLGDWGTQFGKMIVAYKKWGDYEKICKDPINELTSLYVRFHKEALTDVTLEEEAREAFRKMELSDPEYLELWHWIREESLKESAQIYDLLGITFDSYNGEAFYNDKMDSIVDELIAKNLLKEDQGAQIVDLGEEMPPALIKRSDGGSLYITRDLAAVFYRKKEYHFDQILYVVGNEQKLHFNQLKAVVTKMGYDFADSIEHINFGLYLTDGKKMSTRKGGVVKLYDVLMSAIQLAYDLVSTKNPNLENKEDIAKAVGIAAIVFGDLKNHRSLDIEFNLEQAVKFEGQTGPYLQYTSVRIASILKNKDFDVSHCNIDVFEKPHYFELVKQISLFKITLERAAIERAPSVVAKYLLGLAQSFNKFYSIEKINVEDEEIRNSNFALAYATRTVINEGLRLLGIDYVDEM